MTPGIRVRIRHVGTGGFWSGFTEIRAGDLGTIIDVAVPDRRVEWAYAHAKGEWPPEADYARVRLDKGGTEHTLRETILEPLHPLAMLAEEAP